MMDDNYLAAPDSLPAPALPTGGPPRPAPARHRSGPLHNFWRRERSRHREGHGASGRSIWGSPTSIRQQLRAAAGIRRTDLRHAAQEEPGPYRDELIIASKAGYVGWDGPYGDGGSAKYLFASLHQSLRRLGLDHVDIFYHHRPDPRTPLEETCQAPGP